MNRIDFALCLYAVKDLFIKDVDDRLPFRVIHLSKSPESRTNCSFGDGILVRPTSSANNGRWLLVTQDDGKSNNEQNENIILLGSLDPGVEQIDLRVDLFHGGNGFNMYTLTQKISNLHDNQKIWCDLNNCDGLKTCQVQISLDFEEAACAPIDRTCIPTGQGVMKCLIEIEIKSLSGTIFRAIEKLDRITSVWLSYEFLGVVVKSKLFSPCIEVDKFPSRRDTFVFHGTHDEARSLLTNGDGILRIHLQSQRLILGSFDVRLLGVFYRSENGTDSSFQQEGQDIILDFNPAYVIRNCEDKLSLHMSVQLKMKPIFPSSSDQNFHYVTTNCNMVDFSNDEMHSRCESESFSRILSEKKSYICDQTRDDATKRTTSVETHLDEKHKQWTIFRRKEEEKFRRHLRRKEESVRVYLEQEAMKNQEKYRNLMGNCRAEYLNLEKRLKNTLISVEAKEREMERTMVDLEGAHKKRMAEIELKGKLFRSETKNMIDIEQRKFKKATEEAANLKAQKEEVEKELKSMRTKYQQSDAGGPQKEIAELRSRLVDVESRLARERAIHHELMTEKEHFRLAAHKLAKVVRQKKIKQKSSPSHLESDDFGDEISDNFQELGRIKSELALLIQPD